MVNEWAIKSSWGRRIPKSYREGIALCETHNADSFNIRKCDMSIGRTPHFCGEISQAYDV
jgi:hypothetical protein